MISGRFIMSRPTISGLLLFPRISRLDKEPLVAVSFVVDTGADATLVLPADYEAVGMLYRDFRSYPLSYPSGYGGSMEARNVPTALFLRHDDGRYDRISLEAEIAKPDPRNEDLPSVLGRDALDLFRLVIDRSVSLVCLNAAKGPIDSDHWPDEDANEA